MNGFSREEKHMVHVHFRRATLHRTSLLLVCSIALLMVATSGCQNEAVSLDVEWDIDLGPAAALPPPVRPVRAESHPTPPFHEYLEELSGPYKTLEEATEMCKECHDTAAEEVLESVHWTWRAPSPGMVGREGGSDVGKVELINNFFIAVPSNEGYCTACHAGSGWKDDSFDRTEAAGIDCLVCHERTGTYRKAEGGAGRPADGVDLSKVAKSVGLPSRANCGTCHFYAEGGDNVKSGDLGSDLANPTPEQDVHMGGRGFLCQTCHRTKAHKMAGSAPHLAGSDGRVTCRDCHEGKVHLTPILNRHTERLACQTCHIPRFARTVPTLVHWDWSTAGRDDESLGPDEYGKPSYDKRRGHLGWARNVRPVLAWWNGDFNRMTIGDEFDETPVDLASPVGDRTDGAARLYPFKITKGKQAADRVHRRLLVPHLFGREGGDNPYWERWDWDKAFEEGMAHAGVEYSGQYDWVETTMYIPINHGVVPKEMALGCDDCHNGGIDFRSLGYVGDPKFESQR